MMVARRSTQSVTQRSTRQSELHMTRRPRRLVPPKTVDDTVGLSRKEERELKKALYASLQETRRNRNAQSEVDESPTPDTQLKIRKSMRQAALTGGLSGKGSRTSSVIVDESSQDSLISTRSVASSTASKKKIQAQRKFAQGCSLPGTPSTTPNKKAGHSPHNLLDRVPKTEDFLTFLCLRGSHILPPHLDFFNFARDGASGEECNSRPRTPVIVEQSNTAEQTRESTPESSSSGSNMNEELMEITTLSTPSRILQASRKAARASAGTPDTARGIVSLRQGLTRKPTCKTDASPVKAKGTLQRTGSQLCQSADPTFKKPTMVPYGVCRKHCLRPRKKASLEGTLPLSISTGQTEELDHSQFKADDRGQTLQTVHKLQVPDASAKCGNASRDCVGQENKMNNLTSPGSQTSGPYQSAYLEFLENQSLVTHTANLGVSERQGRHALKPSISLSMIGQPRVVDHCSQNSEVDASEKGLQQSSQGFHSETEKTSGQARPYRTELVDHSPVTPQSVNAKSAAYCASDQLVVGKRRVAITDEVPNVIHAQQQPEAVASGEPLTIVRISPNEPGQPNHKDLSALNKSHLPVHGRERQLSRAEGIQASKDQGKWLANKASVQADHTNKTLRAIAEKMDRCSMLARSCSSSESVPDKKDVAVSVLLCADCRYLCDLMLAQGLATVSAEFVGECSSCKCAELRKVGDTDNLTGGMHDAYAEFETWSVHDCRDSSDDFTSCRTVQCATSDFDEVSSEPTTAVFELQSADGEKEVIIIDLTAEPDETVHDVTGDRHKFAAFTKGKADGEKEEIVIDVTAEDDKSGVHGMAGDRNKSAAFTKGKAAFSSTQQMDCPEGLVSAETISAKRAGPQVQSSSKPVRRLGQSSSPESNLNKQMFPPETNLPLRKAVKKPVLSKKRHRAANRNQKQEAVTTDSSLSGPLMAQPSVNPLPSPPFSVLRNDALVGTGSSKACDIHDSVEESVYWTPSQCSRDVHGLDLLGSHYIYRSQKTPHHAEAAQACMCGNCNFQLCSNNISMLPERPQNVNSESNRTMLYSSSQKPQASAYTSTQPCFPGGVQSRTVIVSGSAAGSSQAASTAHDLNTVQAPPSVFLTFSNTSPQPESSGMNTSLLEESRHANAASASDSHSFEAPVEGLSPLNSETDHNACGPTRQEIGDVQNSCPSQSLHCEGSQLYPLPPAVFNFPFLFMRVPTGTFKPVEPAQNKARKDSRSAKSSPVRRILEGASKKLLKKAHGVDKHAKPTRPSARRDARNEEKPRRKRNLKNREKLREQKKRSREQEKIVKLKRRTSQRLKTLAKILGRKRPNYSLVASGYADMEEYEEEQKKKAAKSALAKAKAEARARASVKATLVKQPDKVMTRSSSVSSTKDASDKKSTPQKRSAPSAPKKEQNNLATIIENKRLRRDSAKDDGKEEAAIKPAASREVKKSGSRSTSSSPATKKASPKKSPQEKLSPALAPTPDPALAGMDTIPTFYPTEDDFVDPVSYIASISDKAEPFGMARIIPPASWKMESKVNEEIRFTTQIQHLHRLFNRWGPGVEQSRAITHHLRDVIFDQNSCIPQIGGVEVDLPQLYRMIRDLGGLQNIVDKKQWVKVADAMKIPKAAHDRVTRLYDVYCKYVLPYAMLTEAERQQAQKEVHTQYELSSAEDDAILKGKSMTLSSFSRIARNVQAMWFKDDPHPDMVEAAYWKIVKDRDTHVAVQCAHVNTRAQSTAFPTRRESPYFRHSWNLNNLPDNKKCILKCLGPVSGATIPTLHVGMLFSTSCWSTDPHRLPYMQYLHSGANTIWYCIPKADVPVFHEVMKEICPTLLHNDPLWLKEDIAMVKPDELISRGVRVARCVQRPRQFVVVFPDAYTATVCCGYNVSESVHYATTEWLSLSMQAAKALCESGEKELFSVDTLVCGLCQDSADPDTLGAALPLLEIIVKRELDERHQLSAAGLRCERRLAVEDSPGTSASLARKRSHDLTEDSACEVCFKICYLSMVLNEHDEQILCLEHGLRHVQRKKHVKAAKLFYRYTEEELTELVQATKDRLAALANGAGAGLNTKRRVLKKQDSKS